MKRYLRTLGGLVALVAIVSAIPCDRTLSSEMSYAINGRNLVWPSSTIKNYYRQMGLYNPRNIIATRAQIVGNNAVITMPRCKSGVPFTLGTFPLNRQPSSTQVAPYPNLDFHDETKCTSLKNAVDVVATSQYLWVLDDGIVNSREQPIKLGPPKVVAFDLKTHKPHRFVSLKNLVYEDSKLQYLTVDRCSDGSIFLYIADAPTKGIIVFDIKNDRGYRIALPGPVLFGAPSKDCLQMVLVNKNSDDPILYFSYMGCSRLFSIRARNLRCGKTNGTVIDVGPKDRPIVLLGTDATGSIYFREKGESDIYRWNTATPFISDNFQRFQTGNECRLLTHVFPGRDGTMWGIESNIRDFLNNTVSCEGPSISLHPLRINNANY